MLILAEDRQCSQLQYIWQSKSSAVVNFPYPWPTQTPQEYVIVKGCLRKTERAFKALNNDTAVHYNYTFYIISLSFTCSLLSFSYCEILSRLSHVLTLFLLISLDSFAPFSLISPHFLFPFRPKQYPFTPNPCALSFPCAGSRCVRSWMSGQCSTRKTRSCVNGSHRWRARFLRMETSALRRWLRSCARWFQHTILTKIIPEMHRIRN